MTERLLSAIDWHLGHVVRRLRLDDGLTQAEIAESTGLALSKIQRLEDRGEATLATTRAVAERLNTTISALTAYADKMQAL